MQWLKIIALCTLAAITYGIVHDQVTVRICIEYFTIGHPRIIESEDPTLLALAWGVVATWWVGLPLGLGVASVARLGRLPKRSAQSLVRPLLIVLAVTEVTSIISGFLGAIAFASGAVRLLEPIASRVPSDQHIRFGICLWAHSAAYFVGVICSFVLIVQIWRSRMRSKSQQNSTHT